MCPRVFSLGFLVRSVLFFVIGPLMLCLAPDLAFNGSFADTGQAEHLAPAQVATQETTKAAVSELTQDEISKVYMNCLNDVDKTISVLAGRAKIRAVQSEAESQRAFCANRKRDCKERPNSPECRTFVEEFRNTELSGTGR